MRIKSILPLLVCFVLSGLTLPAVACPPGDCDDCETWDPETETCEWDCSSGQCCDGGSCVDDCPTGSCCDGSCCDSGNCCNSTTCCPNSDDVCCTDSGSYCCDSGETCCQGSCCTTDQCCDDGTCVSLCPTGECCDDGTCVSSCPTGKCCSNGTCVSSCPTGKCCKGGECESPDTTWSTTAGVSVTADDSIKEKVNNAINSIPCVSGVEVTDVIGSVNGKIRECCGGGVLQHEVCSWGSLKLSASLGKIKIWGPPTFVEGVDFGLWGASINVEAGVFIEGDFEAGGTAGLWTNPCGEGCLYGSASLSTTVTVSGSVTAFGCVRIWGNDYCTPTVSGSVSASISFTGTYNFHECGSCVVSGDIALDDITASISVTVGSYTGSFNKTIYPSS